MSPLKLLFFIGISATMMMSVLGFLDQPYFYEDYEEDGILFDKEVTTKPPSDIIYDDIYKSDTVDAIPFLGNDLLYGDEQVTKKD